jgi:Nucleotidyl transferase AbiEii toxin, Type IV TA system
MPRCFDPRLDILPKPQREIWDTLRPAAPMGFVLYGGTAIALTLVHRQSVDFDFFCAEPLNKDQIRAAFPFVAGARVLQDEPNTFVVLALMPTGTVKISFFGGISIGRVADPLQTRDGNLLVASLDDLMATKLKAIPDRAEAKDYRDIAAMIEAGVSLSKGLGTFRAMFRGEPTVALKALGYFGDGDLGSLPEAERAILRSARDTVRAIPEVTLTLGRLAVDIGPCED